jgi:hypothetical protein
MHTIDRTCQCYDHAGPPHSYGQKRPGADCIGQGRPRHAPAGAGDGDPGGAYPFPGRSPGRQATTAGWDGFPSTRIEVRPPRSLDCDSRYVFGPLLPLAGETLRGGFAPAFADKVQVLEGSCRSASHEYGRSGLLRRLVDAHEAQSNKPWPPPRRPGESTLHRVVDNRQPIKVTASGKAKRAMASQVA